MARESIASRLAAQARARENAQTVRVRREVQARSGARVVFDGRPLLNFSSNDYLGLAQHPDLIRALCERSRVGVGSSASHMICGHHAAHAALERDMAEWLAPVIGRDTRALVFGSGYMANLAVVQSLLQTDDVCLQDKLNHASLIDAARLARIGLVRYPHADATAARRQAQAHGDGVLLVATDGVFSMDGDIAPLPELSALARAHEGLLYVDEAHAIGVLGPEGRGSAAAAGLIDAGCLLLVTLGKALGCYGAVLVGPGDVIEHIAQTARAYIYTTAMPPPLATAARAALKIAREETWRRRRLRELLGRFRDGARMRGIPLLPSHTPIQPLLVGDNETALLMAQQLEERGLLVAAIRPPSVPSGQARLRITLSSMHTDTQVDALLSALDELTPRVAREARLATA